MKKFTISILLLLTLSFLWTVSAQVNLYTFTSSSGSYTEITGGTVLGTGTIDDNSYNAKNIGFTFNFGGTDFTQFSVNANGFMALGASVSSSYLAISGGTTNNVISPCNADLNGNTGAELSYLLSGTTPDQVLTIQWKDFRHYNATSESYNFQVKLYETTNKVEFVYGTYVKNSSNRTKQVGLRGTSSSVFNNRTTTTNWAATTAGATNTATCTLTSAIYPASGLTFTFTPPVAGTPDPPTNPSPANLATGVAVDGSLTWTFGANTATYDLWFGPSGSMVEVVSGATADASGSYPYSGILTSQSYHWQVIEHNGDLTTNGPTWSFTTACGAVTVPYQENFDGTWVGSPAAPACWKVINANSDSYYWSQSNQYIDPTHSPLYAAHGMGNTNDYLITPLIDLTGVDALIKWWDKVESATKINSYKILVSTTTSEIASFTNELGDFSCANTTWTQHEINLSAYKDQSIYVAFYQYASASSYYGFGIDDFTLEEVPDCLPPSGLTVNNITTNSADLGWNENGTATTWNIEFGDADFTPSGVATYTTQENPFHVGDLEPASGYDFYVQADCGAKAASPWVGPFTFFTACDVVTAPYQEDFDGTWSGSPAAPTCWTVINANSDSYYWSQSNQYIVPTHSPLYAAHGMGNTNDYLITPLMDLTGVDALIKWWDKVESPNYINSYKVLVSTTTPEIASFTVELGNFNCANTAWTQHEINLSAYKDQNIYVAFYQYASAATYYGFGIDDFTLDIVPPPGTVSGIVTETISGDPIQDVTVTAEPGGLQATTNALGEYTLDLDAGQYDLTFENSDYYPYTESGVVVVSAETTTLDVNLDLLDAPYCADVVAPADNDFGVLPDISLEWAPADGSAPASGYRILLYNITADVWVENETDLGNVTSYTPVVPFDWGSQYVWLIKPYNNTGEATDCVPWYFTTAFSGMIDGNVLDTQSGLPVEGVSITLEEVFPNAGFSMDFTTDAAGNWDVEWETGIYNIYFWKYGYLSKTMNNVSIFANQTTVINITLDPVVPFTMPFVEDWTAPKPWSVTGENWYITTDGNPANSAMFYYDPVIVNYEQDLFSYYIDGRDESKVYAQFDLYFADWSSSTIETMSFMVFDGEQWNIIETIDNQSGSIDWTTLTFDITDYAAGKQFLIGFRAEGVDSDNIYYWLIDNILVTNSIMEVEPASIYDALFPGETSVWDIDIQNYGNGDLNWNAELLLPAPWAVLSQTSGVGAPGGETIQLTFDANAVVPGHYEAEIVFTDEAGVFEKTVALMLDTYADPGQKIMIPEANEWGYISSYVNMDGKMTLEEAMADILDEMIIMVGKTGIFWPVQNVNTLGNWNSYEGYKLKMGEKGLLAYVGDEVTDKTVSFGVGTYIVPVLSTEPVSVESIFLNKPVDFAFSLDGSIYWPAGGIQTLNQLEPGYGYLVRFSAPAVLNFGTKGQGVSNNPPKFVNNTSWNDVTKTGDVHIIGVSAEASAELISGDVLGMFNLGGNCVGMAQYSGNGETFAVTVFADDNTTEAIDGMIENEPLTAKIFRDGDEFEVNPVYSMAMPNSDGNFAINGLSMITSLKLGATSIFENPMSAIRIYPNPSDGVFNISGAENAVKMIVTNSQGQVIMNNQINNTNQLDLSGQPTGIYFVKLIGDQGVKLEKLIIR